MALRAVPDHPKFAHLKSLLKTTKGATLGYLECVWHFAGRFTPQGNLGKYSDSSIESWCEWDGENGALVHALIESKWVDKDPNFRLLVHDWETHADKATKQALKRGNLGFCTPAVDTPGVQGIDLSGLPVPVPVPEPVPEPRKRSVDSLSVKGFFALKNAYHQGNRGTSDLDWKRATEAIINCGISDQEIENEVVPWVREELSRTNMPRKFYSPETLFTMDLKPWKPPLAINGTTYTKTPPMTPEEREQWAFKKNI